MIDFWYADHLSVESVSFADVLEAAHGRRFQEFVFRFGVLRAVVFFWYSQGYDLAIPNWPVYGRTACVLQALSRQKKIILLEAIDFANMHERSVRTYLLKFFVFILFRPAFMRSVRSMQVMTNWERERFCKAYGVAGDRVAVVMWPLFYSPTKPTKTCQVEPYVFASGRAGCDWKTLYHAAQMSRWPLKIVCSGADRPNVVQLDAGRGRWTVLSDIPESEHNELLANASVCVISLEERYASTGQIRLGSAIALGVPVVASRVVGLEGYLVEGVTGRGVAVGSADEMAAAIDRLFFDREDAESLAQKAGKYAEELTSTRYFEEIDRIIQAEIN